MPETHHYVIANFLGGLDEEIITACGMTRAQFHHKDKDGERSHWGYTHPAGSKMNCDGCIFVGLQNLRTI